MEPNRYTAVPERSPETYRRAAEYMRMIHGFVLANLDRVPTAELRAARKQMAALVPALRQQDRAAQIRFNDEFDELAALVDNPLLAEAEQRVRSQAQFHLQHPDVMIDWDGIVADAERLIEWWSSAIGRTRCSSGASAMARHPLHRALDTVFACR
jgi:DNA-binding GntR family transcriptional regulator